MSEAEIKRRQDYKRNRSKWIFIQTVAIVAAIVIALGSFLIFDRMNRTYYIEYTEGSSADYNVHYVNNEHFDSEWIKPGQSYVSSLTDVINARFRYHLDMNQVNVGFDYSYGITAQLVVADKTTGDHIYDPIEVLLPETKATVLRDDSLSIVQAADVNFAEYNKRAEEFIKIYNLKNADAHILVTMKVDVVSRCDQFENNNENNHTISLVIPLCQQNFSIKSTASAPSGESKVLACNGGTGMIFFKVLAIVFSCLAVVFSGLLIAFVYLTRNEDVNYSNKVKKILNAYRSFIQQIEGEFNTEGYQIVQIKSFTEMLGIRDTIQSPVLMWENRDETMTQFLIPTATKLLYTFEIKVDNYDSIYGITPEPQDSVYEFDGEGAIILDTEEVDMDELAEAMAAPDVVLEEIDYVADDDVDFEGDEEHPGLEVVGVVWPEKKKNNKVYKYDPAGESLQEGDMVLVPTRDEAKDREVIRKAAIAHANHTIDPETHPHALKKIIGVIKRRAEAVLSSDNQE